MVAALALSLGGVGWQGVASAAILPVPFPALGKPAPPPTRVKTPRTLAPPSAPPSTAAFPPTSTAVPPSPPESVEIQTPAGAPGGLPGGQPSPPPLTAPVTPEAARAGTPPNVIAESKPTDVAASAEPALDKLRTDELPNPGYVPGYRTYQSLSMSPYAPNSIALPGGVTAGYGAPLPLDQWTFRWNGTLSASLQESVGQRAAAAPGQGTTIFNAPPRTIDEYASFVGTSTMPGQWAALNFAYAKQLVSVNLSINTWNPTEPTTFYQIGSQLFINTLDLQYDFSPLNKLTVHALLGYFPAYAGGLGQYGPGMYTNHLVGLARGVGEDLAAEYALGPTWSLLLEDGFVGTRNGKVPSTVVPTGGNAGNDPIFPAAWVHHLHLGFLRSGEPTIRARVHYMTNWAHDDRTQTLIDNHFTRAIDESHPRDGRLDVTGFDATMNSATWGYLGVGASYVRGVNAYTLKGLWTYGNDGQALTERWWGQASGGTGKLFVVGANYSASVGRILSRPTPFTSDRPDLVVNTGFVVAYTLTDTNALQGTTLPAGATSPGPLPESADIFNHRLRYKLGADVLYTFLSFMGAGVRVDRVAPTSKDAGETFHVLAARLIFKSNWSSRDTITILYGKWFYGPRSHPEASSIVPADIGRLDDQLFAINANLSW